MSQEGSRPNRISLRPSSVNSSIWFALEPEMWRMTILGKLLSFIPSSDRASCSASPGRLSAKWRIALH